MEYFLPDDKTSKPETTLIIELLFLKIARGGYNLDKMILRTVMTVGDGDLSFSLAMARCFGPRIRVCIISIHVYITVHQ